MHPVFAFSISHFVSSVGADAGFAAIIGLAILVLLYFAQARETSTLRDEATAANQRVGELERRVAQLGRSDVAPAPRPAVAPAPQAAVPLISGQPATATASSPQHAPLPGQGPAAIPAAPAGVAAPALIDATRLIPTPEPVVQDAVAAAAASQSAEEQAVGTAVATATPPPATAAAGAADPATRPASTGSNGTGDHAVPPPVPASATAGPAPQQAAPRQAAPAPRRVKIRPGGPVPPSLSLGGTASRSPARRWLPVLLAVLLVGAIVAVLLVVTSAGGSNKARSSAGTPTTNAPSPATSARFKPSSVTVAVLNGTDVAQLAHRVAQKLQGTGYRKGAVQTAADQTHTSTIVAYVPGSRRDAVKVASALKLPTSSVQPADKSAQAVACPPPAACRANVIVTVGSDLSSTP